MAVLDAGAVGRLQQCSCESLTSHLARVDRSIPRASRFEQKTWKYKAVETITLGRPEYLGLNALSDFGNGRRM